MSGNGVGPRPSALGLRVAALALPLLVGACDDWFTTFKEQPKVEPWEVVYGDSVSYRGQPQGSIPITGELVPAWRVSYAPAPNVVDSMSGLANPVAPDERSLANGRRYFQVNCAVCHGDTGAGNGPVTRYGFPGINLLTPLTQNRTDGYIFGIIRNGRGAMPTYNRIEEMDRWDVVNYVRGLQGRLGAPVETGPVGRPGEGGAAVPGYTRTAPTRPAPFFNPSGGPSGAAADTAAAGARSPAAGGALLPRPGQVQP